MTKTRSQITKPQRPVRHVFERPCPKATRPQTKHQSPKCTRGTARQTPRTRRAVAATSSGGESRSEETLDSNRVLRSTRLAKNKIDKIPKQVQDAQIREVAKKRSLEKAAPTSSSTASSTSDPPALRTRRALQAKNQNNSTCPSKINSSSKSKLPTPNRICKSKISEDEGNGRQKHKLVSKKKRESAVVIPDHIEILNDNPPMYRCNFDGKQFKAKAHIKYHESCQKGDADKPFLCNQCGRGFIAKSHFEYHKRTHTGERPYICCTCGKNFPQKGKLTRHMTTHTGERRFKCQECDKRFVDKQALKAHMRTHTGERPFACSNCDKRFTNMTNLKKHNIRHTGERPFTCGTCNKSFGLQWTLAQHSLTHLNERPHVCPQCPMAFLTRKDLNRHLTVHSNERPFECGTCGRAFPRKDNRDRHVRNTHNNSKKLEEEAAVDHPQRATEPESRGGIRRSKMSSIVGSKPIKKTELLQSVGSEALKPKTRVSTTSAHQFRKTTLPVEKEGSHKGIPEQDNFPVITQNGSQEGEHAVNDALVCPSVPESVGVGSGRGSMGENGEAPKGERSRQSITDERPLKCWDCGKVYRYKRILARHLRTHEISKKGARTLANGAAAHYLQTVSGSKSEGLPMSKSRSTILFNILEWVDPTTSTIHKAPERVIPSKSRHIRAKRWACKTLHRVAYARHLRISERPCVEIEKEPASAQFEEKKKVPTLVLVVSWGS